MDNLIKFLYWYATDFCINLANMLGISYQEFNAILFLITIPLGLSLLVVLNLYRYLMKPIFRKRRNS